MPCTHHPRLDQACRKRTQRRDLRILDLVFTQRHASIGTKINQSQRSEQGSPHHERHPKRLQGWDGLPERVAYQILGLRKRPHTMHGPARGQPSAQRIVMYMWQTPRQQDHASVFFLSNFMAAATAAKDWFFVLSYQWK